MKIFVTGGNGFIGSAVVGVLLDAGHDVRCLVRASSQTKRIDHLPVERVLGDVRELGSIEQAMAGCDATIHLAGPSSWDEINSPALAEIIEGGTRNVLQAAAQLPGHRVVFVSSVTAINGSELPVVFDEDSSFTLQDPALRYAHVKRSTEALCLEAVRNGVEVVIVNPAEVYGPGDDGLITAGNVIDFLSSKPVLVCTGGTSVVHVGDVARGIAGALLRGRSGERYILGGENLTIRQLAELCLEVAEKRSRVVLMPNWLIRLVTRAATALHIPLPFNAHVIPYATRYWFVSPAKAERELGVHFRSARETLSSTVAWLKATGHVL